ncbi:NADH(P)-binding protein, PF13460 family [Bacteriovorax sp. BSW11_IV]|uniref:NADH(P)-binding protein, PF13460 family n=1 Tax=Bacteriovorax sp. BSW11_IV TaxID=1353529 RepID=UPI00038A0483|nr:NADH(P)-binding protein, PF13460 family [Bacteriovorax sp. BSW11_IV]EQC50151.1 NADH(P)-binding protein, PF13460 family [Bacteriovorax sp. BSW11_IV]
MKKILFFGVGHLGNIFLKQNKLHSIIGTKRSADANLGSPIIPYSLGDSWIGPTDFDVVIISFPPSENYAKKIEALVKNFHSKTQIIFISSTSVFGDGLINEMSEREGQARNARELILCENHIKARDNYLIIRPGGLIDENRHPKNFLRKMNSVASSQTNVNLVHTSDVASFIHFAIEKNLINEDYNLVCDAHPTKEEFYGHFHLDLTYNHEGSKLRIIENSKSKSTGFKYNFGDLDWTRN